MASEEPQATTTVTFRIPSALKTLLDAASATSGETATALLRDALERFLGSGEQTYELVGFRPEFTRFLEQKQRAGISVVALLVRGRDGRGYVYDGVLDFNFCNDSLVAMRGGAEVPWIIPRAFVVGWFGDSHLVNQFVTAATRQGWTSVKHTYLA